MGMISKHVSLQCVPGFDNIDSGARYAQCKHEFENDLIKSVVYEGLNPRAVTGSHIMLKTLEAVLGADGTVNEQDIEMLLEKENGGVWRPVQERMLPENNAVSDNLLP